MWSAMSFAVAWLGFVWFTKTQDVFADVISARICKKSVIFVCSLVGKQLSPRQADQNGMFAWRATHCQVR
jgi:hypothetical protein